MRPTRQEESWKLFREPGASTYRTAFPQVEGLLRPVPPDEHGHRRSSVAAAPRQRTKRHGPTARCKASTRPSLSIKAMSSGSAMKQVCTAQQEGNAMTTGTLPRRIAGAPMPSKRSQNLRATTTRAGPQPSSATARSIAAVSRPIVIRPPPASTGRPQPFVRAGARAARRWARLRTRCRSATAYTPSRTDRSWDSR